jgi:uncharacterized membrane protein YeaQ/YmgE (transglycosylase-associated protein family)
MLAGMAVVGSILLAILLFFLAVLVIGWAWSLIVWLLVGLAIGAIARLVLPGAQPIGILLTLAVGIGGSLIGAVVGHVVGGGSLVEFVVAVACAAVLVSALSSRVARSGV